MIRPSVLFATSPLLLASICSQPPALDSDLDLGGEPLVQQSHDLIDFGEVGVGDPSIATALFTLSNVGDGDLHIGSVELDDPSGPFAVGPLEAIVLGPGAATQLEISYQPTTAAADSTQLFIETDAWLGVADVVLLGQGVAPVLSLSTNETLLADATVGCTAQSSIALVNLGNADLVIHELSFEVRASRAEEWWFDGLEGENGDGAGLVELEPGEHRLVTLTYAPMDDVEDQATLTVRSNDPEQPERSLEIEASGVFHDWQLDVFEQPHEGSMDMVVHVDMSGSMNTELSSVITNLRAYASAMAETEVDFQLAVTTADSGCINDSDIWIDNGFTPSEAEDTLDTMVNLGGAYGANGERAFTQLDNTLAETGTGGCNEGLMRENAELHLVAISDEPEQSAAGWKASLAALQLYNADPSDVTIHGVGGDYPSGCSGASAYTGVYEASLATDGLFLSICASSWWPYLLEIGENLDSSLDSFILTEPAVPSTLELSIDGVRTTEGWSFDEEYNTLRFDADHIPEGSAEIEIAYAVSAECE